MLLQLRFSHPPHWSHLHPPGPKVVYLLLSALASLPVPTCAGLGTAHRAMVFQGAAPQAQQGGGPRTSRDLTDQPPSSQGSQGCQLSIVHGAVFTVHRAFTHPGAGW